MDLRKVFYQEVSVEPVEGGFGLALDGRAVKTPGKDALILPTEALAVAVAQEWRVQEDQIRPLTMPLTRLSNSAIGKIPEIREATVAALSGYAQTDLLCFRADGPQKLTERQSDIWDPQILWLKQTHGLVLYPTQGVVAVDQPGETLAAFTRWLDGQGPFALMALHDTIGLLGSIVLARAVSEAAITPQAAWDASVLDEMWNVELWGEDEEAAELRSAKRAEFLAADRFFRLLEGKG